MISGKKRKFEVEQKDTNEFGLPAKYLATSHIRSQEKRLIIILEGAQLETVKVSQWVHEDFQQDNEIFKISMFNKIFTIDCI